MDLVSYRTYKKLLNSCQAALDIETGICEIIFMTLTAEQIKHRAGKLTASRAAPVLMKGDEQELLDLFYEVIGDPRYKPEDLSGVWPVQLGIATETLNLQWFQRKHGMVIRCGEILTHQNGWMACTLDGWSVEHNCPIECKHVGGREKFELIVDRYQPQMHWQMIVTSAPQVAFSVIEGSNEPVVEFVQKDKEYANELWARANAFWLCVESLTPPVSIPPVAPPVRAEKIYDMTASEDWRIQANLWTQSYGAAVIAKNAEKLLKGLVPMDAVRCYGHGVAISRDRAGRLSLREGQGR